MLLMLEGATVKEIREAIKNMDDDMVVVMGANYGDRANTIQAIPADDPKVVRVTESSYSESGYKVVTDEDSNEGQKVVVLNFYSF